MADLTAVLRKTINALPSATPQLRRRVYEKARAAVERQIAASEPPLSFALIESRHQAIEDAIAATEQYYSALSVFSREDELVDDSIPPVELQSELTVTFEDDATGVLDANLSNGTDRVSRTQGSRDRHSELVRAAHRILQLTSPDGTGGNSATEVREAVSDAIEALGTTIEEIRPGLLIARGERLRSLYSDQQPDDGDLGDVIPLPSRSLSALRHLVAAYNGFVILDPELARQDDALLGPDVLKAVSPKEGTLLVESAVTSGFATPRAGAVLEEYAKVVPAGAALDDRRSRRYTEAVRNFLRAAFAKARSLIPTRGQFVAGVGVAAAAARWLIVNEATIIPIFASNPIVQSFFVDLIGILKMLPLVGI